MVALYSFFVTLLLIFREVSSLPSIQNDISLEELGPIEVSQVPGDGQVIETVVEEMPAENGIESPIPGLSPGDNFSHDPLVITLENRRIRGHH